MGRAAALSPASTMHAWLLAAWIAAAPSHAATPPIDLVRVDKSERRMQLLHDGAVVATFRIALGDNPVGHKQREGDERTPEGRYMLDWKKADSAYFRAIHISYPNADDTRRARARGVPPGGAIMVHGQPNGWAHLEALTQRRDWTDGCIALRNADMQTLWDSVRVPVPIEIAP